jgi:hypothetical protein
MDAPVVLASSTSDSKGPYVVKTANVNETGFDVMITDEEGKDVNAFVMIYFVAWSSYSSRSEGT